MLKKLFVHDFSSIFRRLFPLLLGIAGCTALAFATIMIDGFIAASEGLSITMTFLGVLLFLTFFALLVLCEVFIVYYYYKSLFTDEGYLTFMLPAPTETIFTAKLLSSVLWSMIVSVVAVLAILLGVLLPLELSVAKDGATFLSPLWDTIAWSTELPLLILGIVTAIASVFTQITLLYTAINLGCIFFPNKRILASFIAYFVISAATNTVSGIFSVIFSLAPDELGILEALCSLLLSFIYCGVGYLLSRYLLTRKLNLV